MNDCEFVDNNGTFDDLVNKSSKVFGGAVYSSEKKNDNLKCQNCTFINNKVLVKRDNESEFAGALYLVMGETINCTFNENSAFNGCDLMYKK